MTGPVRRPDHGADHGEGTDLLRRYLSELGAHPLLTAADERELGRTMAAGRRAATELALGPDGLTRARRRTLATEVRAGQAARERFVAANLRLVVSIAKRYQRSSLPLLDLIQEGNLGLLRAVEKFDPERGFKFSTYATWWIRQAITRGVAEKSRTIRIPAHVGDAAALAGRTSASLAGELGRDPSVAEVAEASGLLAHQVQEGRDLVRDVVSLSSPLGDRNGGAELADLVADASAEAPFDAAMAGMQREAMSTVLDCLTPRERRVLQLRFGLGGDVPATLEELGREFALTRERVRQIEAKALTKLRHPCAPPALRRLTADAS